MRTMHRLAGHPNRPATDATRLALRAYKRARAEAGTRGRREAPPVGIDTLRAMVSACDLNTRIGLRDRLPLVLGLALMGRRSELVALTCDDVREVPDGLKVTVRTSKTDKDSRDETIAIPRGSHPLTDPVAVWTDWIAVLAEAGETPGRLLRRVDRHGDLGPRLGADAVNVIVRDLAVRTAVSGADTFTAHSLRAGGATVALRRGRPRLRHRQARPLGPPPPRSCCATSAPSTAGATTPCEASACSPPVGSQRSWHRSGTCARSVRQPFCERVSLIPLALILSCMDRSWDTKIQSLVLPG
ncbi:hypothetical protein ACFQVD_08810 [Streptosporangium amethystogenes subsp. fukuiense]|uniref:Tyr recombinase domain-containing protein n=1 Tax=Streptosporangium amethystogenes subsp. fukuiense TaxID=698418 RepID=A0ABW2SVR2_9ACTN